MEKWSNTRLFTCLQFRQVEYCDLFQNKTTSIGMLTDYKPTICINTSQCVIIRHSLNFFLLNYNQFYLNCSELLFLNWGYMYIVVYMQTCALWRPLKLIYRVQFFLTVVIVMCNYLYTAWSSFMICWKVLQNAISTRDSESHTCTYSVRW